MEDALYHLNVSWISRGEGRSAVAAAAYRAAERLMNNAANKYSDFRHKAQRTLHTEVIVPAGSPSWASSRADLWNTLEKVERRKDARLAVEVEFAIPYGVPRYEWERLARQMSDYFTEQGHPVDLAIHTSEDGTNPHVHMMMPMRRLTEDGFASRKNLKFAQRGFLYKIREVWAKIGNQWLAKSSSRTRLDHRSYRDRGLDRTPERHRGADRLERAEKRANFGLVREFTDMPKPTAEEIKRYPLLTNRDEWPPSSKPWQGITLDERIELREYQRDEMLRSGDNGRQHQEENLERTQQDAEKIMDAVSSRNQPEALEHRARERDIAALQKQFFSEKDRKTGRTLEENAARSDAEHYRKYAELEQKLDRAFVDPDKAKENMARDMERIGTKRTMNRLNAFPSTYAKTKGSILTSKGREEARAAREARREIPEKFEELRQARDEANRDDRALDLFNKEKRDDREDR